jgi:hypothetical protein
VRLKLRQVVATYQFITAFDARSQRLGSAVSWFDLPSTDRAKCTVGLPASRAVMKLVSRDFFQQIAYLCSGSDVAVSGDAEAALGCTSYNHANTEASERGSDVGSPRAGYATAYGPSQYQDRAGELDPDGSCDRLRTSSRAFIELVPTQRGSQEVHNSRAQQSPDESGVHGQIANSNAATETGDSVTEHDKPSRQTDGAPSIHLSEPHNHNAGHGDPAESASPFPEPVRDWSQRDFLRFLQSWSEAVDAFLDYGNVEEEKVKLPSWLIRQRWMHHGGSRELTVDSITDMKRYLILAFQAVCTCLSEFLDDRVDAEAFSSWFLLSSGKRLQRVRDSGLPETAQRLAYKLDEGIFNQIAAILNREAMLSMVTEHQESADNSHLSLPGVTTDGPALAGQARSPLSPPTAQPVPIFHVVNLVEPQVQLQGAARTGVERRRASIERSLSPYRRESRSSCGPRKISSASAPHLDRLHHYEPAQARHRVQNKPTADEFADRDDEGAIQAFLDSSQRGFDQLMRSLRMERIRERRVHYTFVLDTLIQRCSPRMDSTRAAYLQELALLQSQQLFVNFVALHRKREREREQRRCVVRRAVRWSVASAGHSLAHQQHLENDAVPDASDWRSLRR